RPGPWARAPSWDARAASPRRTTRAAPAPRREQPEEATPAGTPPEAAPPEAASPEAASAAAPGAAAPGAGRWEARPAAEALGARRAARGASGPPPPRGAPALLGWSRCSTAHRGWARPALSAPPRPPAQTAPRAALSPPPAARAGARACSLPEPPRGPEAT